MSTERKGLDLSDFAGQVPAEKSASDNPHGMRARLERRAIDEIAEFRRRDPADELTITIRGPSATISSFKLLCRTERRSQAEMLRRMMAAYGAPRPGDD